MVDFNLRKLPPQGGAPRDVAQAVNLLIDGKTNGRGSFTLTASSATSVISDFRVGEDSIISMTPITSNAAAEVGAGTMFVSARADSSFTITHANNSQSDRTFIYTVT
jgi:hypothetical protein|tara:strand:+ start:271 stop:591 length:321 start_codon:yes stop_codon:yes gene_type:complete